MSDEFSKEVIDMNKAYEKRKGLNRLYTFREPYYLQSRQKFEREFIKIIYKIFPDGELDDKKVFDVGCGNGKNILKMIDIGFNPKNLYGADILEERIITAKKILPPAVSLYNNNALEVDFKEEFFDVVFESVVFSCILNPDFRKKMAQRMWNLTKKGGYIIWYDLIYDNPRNKNIKAVPLREVREFFPTGIIKSKKIIIAPPLGRIICKIHPALFNFFELFPFLRTYSISWIKKV